MDEACELYLQSIGFGKYIPIFKENDITKSDIPQLFESNEKYLKEIIPKAIDRMNFEKKFCTYYEQTENFASSSSEFEIKKRKVDFFQSDCSSESSCSTPIILDFHHVAEQENYDVVFNDIDLSSLIASNKEVAYETEKQKEDTTSEQKEDTAAVHLFSENSDIKDNYVYKILIKSVEGKNIFAQYKRIGLDNNDRLKVAHMVIISEFGCDTHKIIDTKRFHFLANEIEKLFPGELKDTYYIPSYTPKGGKTVQARGKLIDKYNTIARSIRENGIRSIRPGKSNTIPPKQNLPATNFPLLESEKHLTIENCLEFLSTRLSPWDQIERYWKHTSHVRLNKLQLGTTLSSDDTLNSTAASQEEGGEKEEQPHALKVCNYFQIYKCLKQPLGYTLLEYDFSVLHPEASMRMVTHWNEFRKKVKIELEKIGEHHKNTDAEILCGLPSLFSVVPVKVPKGNWRPNRAEIRQGFLLHLQTITDLEKITKSWKKDLVKKGLALQPFPFVVEDDLSSVTSNYVYIDGEIILLESPTRAVEVAFKFYHALHCEYPAQSERVWIVLQKTLFNLNLPEDSINRQAQQPDVKRLTECLRCA